MNFNSLDYGLFFFVVVSVYFALPYRLRWVLLLASSYFFYMCWKPEYVLLIILSTVVDYWAGLQMGKHANRAGRRKYLIASLVTNLGLLFAFKYFNFFNESLREVADRFRIAYDVPALDVLLPVGISFYTFQTLSYSIDVYRGLKQPERHLGVFAVYVAFFPQLVAGPIERAVHFLPQFHVQKDFDYDRVRAGLQIIIWGLFKKVVVADRLAIYSDSVFNNAAQYDSAVTFAIATYFFAFQIYCDFSGYSDIAIGSAKVLGFDLVKNFRTPYFSQSIAEFWARWHISLSTWFRDYLYIPLGGNRVPKPHWYANLLIVFLVSGLWHGANWTFVVWGGLHGIYLICGLWIVRPRQRLAAAFGGGLLGRAGHALEVLVTFHLVCLGWVFFRANTLGDAVYIVRTVFTGPWSGLHLGNASHFGYALLGIALLLTVDLWQLRRGLPATLDRLHPVVRWALYVGCILVMLTSGVFDGGQFIYFQF